MPAQHRRNPMSTTIGTLPKPYLRIKLIAILVSMLGIACLIIGISSYTVLSNSLMDRAHGRLDEAAHRAASFKPGAGGQFTPPANTTTDSSDSLGDGCIQVEGRTLLNAPGQSTGTLSLCTANGETRVAGLLDSTGTVQTLSQADQEALLAVTAEQGATELSLEAGDYLVLTQNNPADTGIVITGVPLEDTHRTLTLLIAVTAGGSLAVMLIAGLLGSWIIRRTMRPLERVSEVATNVSRLDLALDTLPEASRVKPEDSYPGDEVGAVGHALNQLLDNVQSALEARSRTEEQMRVFVADASHELRTPLAAIKGYADMLKWTETLTDQGKTSLDRVTSQTARMSRLVDDLLLLARLDEGREPVMETVDLTELVLENVMDLQVAAPSHTWNLNLPDDIIEVRGDTSQLQQVLLNLLSNARKHTDDGTTVTTGLAISANGRDAILSVTDNGPGIDPAFRTKIFDRFTRADKARSGSDGTTGLGLPIVKAIVEAHNGTIDVVSTPGRTEFVVRLPLDAPAEA